jgi:hypothetical protein
VDYLIVEHPHPSGGHGAHRKLLMARNAQLPHHEDVQRCVQYLGHLVRYRNAAARQRQHDYARLAGILLEPGRQYAAGLGPVREQSWAHVSSHSSRATIPARRR